MGFTGYDFVRHGNQMVSRLGLGQVIKSLKSQWAIFHKYQVPQAGIATDGHSSQQLDLRGRKSCWHTPVEP